MDKLFFLFIMVSWFCFIPFSMKAQGSEEVVSEEKEVVQIIVTTNTITVGANFSGHDLYIAGVLENMNPLFRQQNRYDVIVSLEGQTRSMIVREKKRKAGMWINADCVTFKNAPLFYSMVTTREIDNITDAESYKRLGLGLSYFFLSTDEKDQEKTRSFRNELIELQKAKNLYHEEAGGVYFGSGSLFTAHFQLPANVPVGRYHVNAYLFRDGQYISSATTTLEIVKAYVAYTIFHEARKHSFWYGIVAVFVAMATGFLCRFAFRKD
ncbi:MAG: Transmembrane protein co-occuring with sulfite exporter TauE/SafE [Bartonella clarridgeiae]|nr:TIGR02186 family protein [Bartonella clarridgeiae]WCR55438.1 MAG: Transmembrane protein co-occuring with sulfite exporter TauE/SafE [Bartonella clarridgeiae]